MENQKKLCPFKKQIKREFHRAGQRPADMVLKERLGYCAGERCMAYQKGRCLRLESEGAQSE